MKKSALVELFPFGRAVWIIGVGESAIAGSGSHEQCLLVLKNTAITDVTLIPEMGTINPEFVLHPRASWWQSATQPTGAWVYPTRQLPNEHEYIVLEDFGSEFSDFASDLMRMDITYTVDIGIPRHNNQPGIYVRIHEKETFITVSSEGIPLVVARPAWGIRAMDELVANYAAVTDPRRVLRKYGLLRTHHEQRLLELLVAEVEVGLSELFTLAHMHTQPYQHPWLLQKPEWIMIESDDTIPGLAEFIAARCELQLVRPVRSLATREIFVGRWN